MKKVSKFEKNIKNTKISALKRGKCGYALTKTEKDCIIGNGMALQNAKEVFMEKQIYFDHAATTPLDKEVLNKMLPYFTDVYGNADSPHALGRKAMNAVDEARCAFAEEIGAKANEVYFTSGGTESGNWAIRCGAYAKKAEGRTHIAVSAIEHHAVKETAAALEKEGFLVSWIPVNEGGRVEMESVKACINANTGLIAVMAANNETGVLQPIEEIAALAHENGSLFFTDAVQYAPYKAIDVKELGVDFLSVSAHKFYGPKGCGALYIKSGIKVQNLIIGGEQERGLRGGTVNVPSVVGLSEAYKKNKATMSESNEKIKDLRDLFLSQISCVEGVFVNGDLENALPSVLNLRIDGVENAAFLYNMDLKGVCLAAGSACASASIKPSHVLTAMGLEEKQAKSSVRISFGKNNTKEEVLRATELFVETIGRLRKF